MGWRRRIGLAVQGGILILAVALVAGSYAGQPVLVSYVETGSMAPTLDPGDGFVAVPAAITGPPEPGTVIVFEAEEIQGGGLTTHRVVDQTERGYITRGDANPFTDQDSNEPPVKEPQIVAIALQTGGSVVEIPHLGTVVMGIQTQLEHAQRWLAATLGTRSLLGTQGIAVGLFAVSVAAYGIDLMLARLRPATKQRTRSNDRDSGIEYRLLIIGAAGVVMLAATAAMVVPAGSTQIGIVSAEFTSEQPTVIQQGTTGEIPYAIGNGGLVPTVVYLDTSTDGMTASPDRVHLGPRENANITLSVTAPPDTGYYRHFLVEHRYLALLPPPVIDQLYRIHPWLPVGVINLLIGGGIYALGRLVLPDGRARLRTRSTKRT